MLIEVEPTFGEFTFPTVKSVRGCMLYRYAVQNAWDYHVIDDLADIADNLFSGAGVKKPSQSGIVVLGLDGKLYCDTLISRQSLIMQVSGSVEDAVVAAKVAIGNYMSLSEKRNRILYNASNDMPAHLDTLSHAKILDAQLKMTPQQESKEQQIIKMWRCFMTSHKLDNNLNVTISKTNTPNCVKVVSAFSLSVVFSADAVHNNKITESQILRLRDTLNFHPGYIKTYLSIDNPIEVILDEKHEIFEGVPGQVQGYNLLYRGTITVRTADPCANAVFNLVHGMLKG